MERKVPNCSLCQFPWHKYSHHGWFQTINSLATSLWDLAIGSHENDTSSLWHTIGYVCVCMYVFMHIHIHMYIYMYIHSFLHLRLPSLNIFLLPKVRSFDFSIECLLVVNHALAELFENRFISLTLLENSFILHLFLLSIEC